MEVDGVKQEPAPELSTLQQMKVMLPVLLRLLGLL